MSTLEKPHGRRDRPNHHITRTTRHPRRAARRLAAGVHPQVQQRYVIESFDTFGLAHKAKEKLLAKFPDDNYQIRKQSNRFAVVKRFKINQIKAAQLPDKKGKSRG